MRPLRKGPCTVGTHYCVALTSTPLSARRKLEGRISEFEQEAALVARQAKAELTASLRTREVQRRF